MTNQSGEASPSKIKVCKKCGLSFSSKVCVLCKNAASRAWAMANKEKRKAIQRAYYEKNHEKIHAVNAVWKSNNHESYKATAAARRERDKEKIRQQKAEYHLKNRELLNARKAEWQLANPEACRVSMQNRRARVKAALGRLSKGLPQKLFELQRGKCACCGNPLGDNYHLDHIMPLSRGGTNTDDNMQLLTQRCNNQKHAKDPIEFMQSRGFLL